MKEFRTLLPKEEIEPLIFDYENMLLRNAKRPDVAHFMVGDDKTKELKALSLIQYISEYYLNWTPEMMRDHLSPEVLKKWKLSSAMKYIRFPEDIKFLKNKWRYIAHMIYPHIVKFDKKEAYIEVYKKVLNSKRGGFPQNFFAAGNGREKVCACLRYAIENNLSFTSVDEMYDYFGSVNCKKFLRETAKLSVHIKMLFDCNIDAMHQMLPPSQQDNFKHQLLRFHQMLNEKISRDNSKKLGRPSKPKTNNLDYINKLIDIAIEKDRELDED